MNFASLPKLQPGDSVGIVSPSSVLAPVFPAEYEFGLARLRDQWKLQPVELPHCKNPHATNEDKMSDLIEAFSNPEIKAVITTIGGDHQVEYVHKLPTEPFRSNPKPFFGYSDNSHFSNFLFLQGIPSYYGGCIYTEYARQGCMDDFTCKYLDAALFSGGERQLEASPEFNDEDLGWGVPENLAKRRRYQPSEGWYWDGSMSASGYTWGGCVESIDEMLRHGREIPSLQQFEQIVLFMETSEELPSAPYVGRVLRALGERGVLTRVQAVLMGRPKGWAFEKQTSDGEKVAYKQEQRDAVLQMVRRYNQTIPVVQNLDFGHTAPMICMPYGSPITVSSSDKTIRVQF